jgi:hypothetical protein
MYLVQPSVSEVVLVLEAEPLAARREDFAQHCRGGILESSLVEVLLHQERVAEEPAIDRELVQVGVGPAHRRLDVLVELVEGAIPDLDATQRAGWFQEPDLELVQKFQFVGRGLRIFGGHPSKDLCVPASKNLTTL